MGAMCPKKTDRCMHLSHVLAFLIKHESRILDFFAERLQCKSIVICQQRTIVSELVADLLVMYSVQHVDVAVVDLNDLDESDCLLMDERFILKESLRGDVEDQGSRAMFHLGKFDDMKKVITEIGKFVLQTTMGLVAMQTERTTANEAEENAPHVMPAELVKVRPATFVKEIIGRHMNRLNKFWTVDDIYSIEEEHRALIAAYRNERNLHSSIDGNDHTTEFNDA
ncbi:hypothetical protein H310_05592 [Aphanomyces invadans]|uniref:Uncharacterized protein n=1 Tax=Aphanomyces invadans TaxID=157072 RepID=A0A024UAD0_9STRA|nr:hypothetical protein H310_05592 [Aphanomyces invadans]ETW03175.1 hypothetical protein H310_05592 [Aphanomyces invadans]|eukprot:XP_008868559.1 hypothetical protein H310_05592 [Aphanomyces invadans]